MSMTPKWWLVLALTLVLSPPSLLLLERAEVGQDGTGDVRLERIGELAHRDSSCVAGGNSHPPIVEVLRSFQRRRQRQR